MVSTVTSATAPRDTLGISARVVGSLHAKRVLD